MLTHTGQTQTPPLRPLSPDAAHPPGTPTFGPFVLEQRLRGGVGWDIHHALAGPRPVCLKRLRLRFHRDAETAELLLSIARGACGLRHPNVVRVLSLGRVEGFIYSAAERMDGVDLATLQRAQGDRRLGPELAALVARDVAAGLDAAHFLTDAGRPLGLVHRAVHAGNVLIGREGDVKLSDLVSFWSRMRPEGEVELSVDEARGFSPEQARGEPLDYRSDVFSLGLILYEMLTGEPAWPGETVEEVLETARVGTVPGVARLCDEAPRELAEVLVGSLGSDRASRYSRTIDMAHDLSAFLCTTEPERVRTRLASLVMLATLVGETGVLETTLSDRSDKKQRTVAPRGETTVGQPPPPLSEEATRVEEER